MDQGPREMSALTHLVCSACGRVHEKGRLWNLCSACGMPLLAQYDLAAARATLRREDMAGRSPDMWRWREVMPGPGRYQPLGEGFTPLLPARRLAKRYGLRHLYIKDESINPTGSFKARGLAARLERT